MADVAEGQGGREPPGFSGREAALVRALLDQGPEATLLCDRSSGRICAAAGPVEQLLGKSVRQLVGQPLSCLLPRRRPAHVAVLGPMHLENPGHWEEVALAGPGEQVRICAVTALPLDDGAEQLVLLRLGDVTERIALQKSLQQMHTRLQQAFRELAGSRRRVEEHRRAASLSLFAAGLAHELNNPLAVAVSNLSAVASMARELGGKTNQEQVAEMEQALSDISASLERVKNIVVSLRELEYRPQAKQMDLVSWLRSRSWLRGIDLRVPSRLEVNSDPHLLERLLTRLLDNARRAAGPRGRVSCSLTTTEDGFCLEVSDDGPGMEAAVCERACDPFFTTRPPGQGLGLGLFLARRAAAMLGGDLELHSAPGQGCRARALLPLEATAGGAEAVSYESLRTAPGG